MMLESRAGLHQTGVSTEAGPHPSGAGSLWRRRRRLTVHLCVRRNMTYTVGALGLNRPGLSCIACQLETLGR